ncbi:hypothetical protein IMSAG192_01130 [Muribaculaceae bacterium]|nr:hypothetical protein IMSAG192_01130 [Muribaculaceae bacterium]
MTEYYYIEKSYFNAKILINLLISKKMKPKDLLNTTNGI